MLQDFFSGLISNINANDTIIHAFLVIITIDY